MFVSITHYHEEDHHGRHEDQDGTRTAVVHSGMDIFAGALGRRGGGEQRSVAGTHQSDRNVVLT